MQRTNDNVVFLNERSWWEWTKLIRKLHGIGLKDEARRLELAVSPAGRKRLRVPRPSSTD
jgi:hypothetical protein